MLEALEWMERQVAEAGLGQVSLQPAADGLLIECCTAGNRTQIGSGTQPSWTSKALNVSLTVSTSMLQLAVADTLDKATLQEQLTEALESNKCLNEELGQLKCTVGARVKRDPSAQTAEPKSEEQMYHLEAELTEARLRGATYTGSHTQGQRERVTYTGPWV